MAGLLGGAGEQPGLLGKLGQALWAYGTRTDPHDMRVKQQRQQILQSAGQNPSLSDVGNRLLQIGDFEGFQAVSRMAEANAMRDWTKTYQGGMLDIQRQQLNQPPAVVKTLEAAGIDPKSKEGHQRLFPRTEPQMSATDKRAIFQAEDEVPALMGTIETLQRAKELNDKTFTGYGAGIRGAIGAKLPDRMVPDFIADPKGSEATVEWENLMSQEAVKNMAESLKGSTTNFELQEFQRRLADPTTPPAVRKRIIDRMMLLAERQKGLGQRRIQDLRGGSYFKPDGGPAAAGHTPAPTGGSSVTGDSPASSGPVRVQSIDEARKLPKGTRFIDPNGVERVVP